MKLTHTNKLKPGMTLIELTVVILVLLTLISVLFIGAQAYKNSADRTACILNIRNAHQGMRAYQNTSSQAVGSAVARTDFIGSGKFVETEPSCPKDAAHVDYAVSAAFPAVGVCGVACTTYSVGLDNAARPADDQLTAEDIADAAAAGKDHFPNSVTGW